MSGPLLDVRCLVKRFGGIVATDRVDLSVLSGEIHALIGPNGAGKTTLVNQLAGSLRPDSGSIVFDGRDITGSSLHKRALGGLARSYQITNVFSAYSVLHNVLLAVQARSGSSLRFTGTPFAEPALVEEALEFVSAVGLGASADAVVATLAYGQRRRVEIALALATRPKLLLLDEPLAGMGTADAAEMIALIGELKRAATIVLVEHDMGAVFRLADRISVLVYGKVIATDTCAEIRRSALVRKAYLGEEDLP